MTPSKSPIVVLGGGISGITAALELSRAGVPVALVEKTPFFGGRAAHFCCKAIEGCQKCGACLVEPRLRDLFQDPGITLYAHNELVRAEKTNGRFRLTFKAQPRCMDPSRCIDCGICADECPAMAQEAILTTAAAAHHPRFAINPAGCLYFKDGSCRTCQEICFPKAIDLDRGEAAFCLETPALVLATGYQPADPRRRPHYRYGSLPQVITGLELEARLRQGLPLINPEHGGPVQGVAFIQCVGSRDQEHPYCSRVCCAYGLRLARLLSRRLPECRVATFYMDLQNVGLDPQVFQAEAQITGQLFRVLPGDVARGPAGTVNLRYLDEEGGKPAVLNADLVVLAVGIGPGPDNPNLAGMLQLQLTPEGFIQSQETLNRTLTGQPGVFLAGTVEGPRSIAECIAQAGAAAREVLDYLKDSGS